MAQTTRSEWWFLVTYATKEEYKPLLEQCQHYALCHHDKDTNEDGMTKEPHTHILVKFETKKSLDQIRTLINSQQNTMGQCQRKVGNDWQPLNKTGCYRYLIHADDSDKYQYEIEDRESDSIFWWSKYADYKVVGTTTADDPFLDDLIAPYQSDYDFRTTMARKYGRDFIKNEEKYTRFRYDYLASELEQDYIDNAVLERGFGSLRKTMDELHLNPDDTRDILIEWAAEQGRPTEQTITILKLLEQHHHTWYWLEDLLIDYYRKNSYSKYFYDNIKE